MRPPLALVRFFENDKLTQDVVDNDHYDVGQKFDNRLAAVELFYKKPQNSRFQAEGKQPGSHHLPQLSQGYTPRPVLGSKHKQLIDKIGKQHAYRPSDNITGEQGDRKNTPQQEIYCVIDRGGHNAPERITDEFSVFAKQGSDKRWKRHGDVSLLLGGGPYVHQLL